MSIHRQPNHTLLVLVLFLIFSSLIIAGGLWWYGNQKQHTLKLWAESLESIAMLKQKQTSDWRQERLNDAWLASRRFKIRDFLLGKNIDKADREELLSQLKNMTQLFDYASIYLVNTKAQAVLATDDQYSANLSETTTAKIHQALTTGKILFSNFYYCEVHKDIHLALVTPVISSHDHDNEVLGALVFVIAPDRFLYPLIQSWPTPSPTAETLLVQQSGDRALFLNTLRHKKDPPLTISFPLTTPLLPAALFLKGKQEPLVGHDYRDVPVLAVARAIPDTPWFLVAKIDLSEIYQPLYREARLIILGVVSLVLLVGAAMGWILTGQRKRHYEQLFFSEQERQALRTHFEYLVKYANDIILLMDQDGNLCEVNDRAVQTYGYPREELLQRNIRDLVVKDEIPALLRWSREDLGGSGKLYECRHRRTDGRFFLAEVSVNLIQVEGQDFFQEIIRDITERKEAENKLIESEARYQLLVDNAAEAIVVAQDGYVKFVNPAANTVSGHSLVDLTTRPFAEFIHPDDRELVMTNYWKRLQGEALPSSYSFRIIDPVNAVKWVQVHAVRIDWQGRPATLNLLTDITENQKFEEGLRSAAQKWRTTFDAVGNAICLLDAEDKVQTCNQAMVNLVGRPFPEIIGSDYRDLVYGNAGHQGACPLARIKKSGKREMEIHQFGDRWLHTTADPILNETGAVTGAVFIIADVTEYHVAIEQIQNLNVILTVIREMNDTLIRTKSEPELLRRICDLMVKIPYNRFTWIGLVESGNFEVKPVAWAGHEDGYLSNIRVTWDDSPQGRGPVGTAIKTGQPAIVNDIENDPKFSPWRQPAMQRSYVSCIAFPLTSEGTTLGSLNVYADKKNAFRADELGFLQQVAGDIAIGVKSLRLEQEMVAGLIKLQVMMIQTIEAIAAMAELRDPYTAGHQQRVTQLALALAQENGLNQDHTEGLRVASLIHDVGKIIVPAEILNRPGKLSEFEMNIIKGHSQAGYDILKKIDFPWPVAQIVLQHHERLNGSGYPQGLQEADILPEAKILAVADVVEAMATHRPYRPALGIEAALDEITKGRGNLYDEEAVEACVRLFKEKAFAFE